MSQLIDLVARALSAAYSAIAGHATRQTTLAIVILKEGAGQDRGDLGFGLSSIAARTSRWAFRSRLGRSTTA